MHRMTIFVLAVLLGVSTGGNALATTTPPKETVPGIVAPSGAGTDRPGLDSRSFGKGRLTPGAWFGLVAELQVSRKQQDRLTPIIRRYVHEARIWSSVGAAQMTRLLAEAKEADPEQRAILMKQARKVRATRPRFERIKPEVIDALNSAQRSRLLELTQSYDGKVAASSRPGAKPERPARAGNAGTVESSPTDAEGAETKGEGPEAKDPKAGPKPWAFVNDPDPSRHVDPDGAGLPEGATPSSPSKEPGGS